MEMLRPVSEYVARVEREQEIERIIVPAFPPTRANKFHIHTLVETEWTENLPLYEIPNDLQKGAVSRCSSTPWSQWLTDS
jgi:hypothetical protein